MSRSMTRMRMGRETKGPRVPPLDMNSFWRDQIVLGMICAGAAVWLDILGWPELRIGTGEDLDIGLFLLWWAFHFTGAICFWRFFYWWAWTEERAAKRQHEIEAFFGFFPWFAAVVRWLFVVRRH